MNPHSGLSSYVLNMISLVSRLIYNYNSKPTPFSSGLFSPLCFRWGDNCLSGPQECLSWKLKFFHTFSEQTLLSNPQKLTLSFDLQLGQRSLLLKLNQLSFLLKQMAHDSWGVSRSERNTCRERPQLQLGVCEEAVLVSPDWIKSPWVTWGAF